MKYRHYILPRKIKFDDTVVRVTLVVEAEKYQELISFLEANPDSGTINEDLTPAQDKRSDNRRVMVRLNMSLRVLNLLKKMSFVYMHHYVLTSGNLRIEFQAKEKMPVDRAIVAMRNGNYQTGEERFAEIATVYCETNLMDDTPKNISVSWPSCGAREIEFAEKFAQGLSIATTLAEDFNKKYVSKTAKVTPL